MGARAEERKKGRKKEIEKLKEKKTKTAINTTNEKHTNKIMATESSSNVKLKGRWWDSHWQVWQLLQLSL